MEKKKRPLIGIMPLIDSERESYWMLPGYMKGIEEAGGIPLMFPLTIEDAELKKLFRTVDGLLITGGQDVSPDLYGEEKKEYCGECISELDEMEIKLFQMAYEHDKPVFGICRGIQFINAVLGGTLYQDLNKEHPSDTEHHQKPPYDVPVHSVDIIEGTALHELLQITKLPVNSYHHQAVKELAPDLECMAVSEDGLVEAVRILEKKFIWAVQWHPECSYQVNETSRRLLEKFVEQCRG